MCGSTATRICVVVSPDVGGVVRARALAKRLESDLAIIDKRRPRPNVAEVMNIIGEVEGAHLHHHGRHGGHREYPVRSGCGTEGEGRGSVLAYCTHPVLSGPALERIANSAIDEVVVTDTIPLREDARQCKKIRQLSVAELLAETMLRISNEESVTSLFME